MSDFKYIITHDGDILAKDLDAKTAVLFAAQYDGWGAEFARDDQGRMALRQSRRHIGNNPWSASGAEPALFGESSSNEDDDDAIDQVVEVLIMKIDQRHKMMAVEPSMDYIKGRLQLALDVFDGDTGPGEWVVGEASGKGSSPRRPALCYKWPGDLDENHPNWGDADAPWKKWGGEAMIDLAGCEILDGTADDGFDCAMVGLK
jgi:hypothetical protein